MQREGWPEWLGMVIGPTATFGIMSALAGLVWSLALNSSLTSGAKWGGIIGAAIIFLLTIGLAPNRHAIKGMGLWFGGLWGIVVVIGLVVWGIRALVG